MPAGVLTLRRPRSQQVENHGRRRLIDCSLLCLEFELHRRSDLLFPQHFLTGPPRPGRHRPDLMQGKAVSPSADSCVAALDNTMSHDRETDQSRPFGHVNCLSTPHGSAFSAPILASAALSPGQTVLSFSPPICPPAVSTSSYSPPEASSTRGFAHSHLHQLTRSSIHPSIHHEKILPTKTQGACR